jgi:hypothetical protein
MELRQAHWYRSWTSQLLVYLKGHGNEADFLRFMQKLVWHWSLTLHFKFEEIFVIKKQFADSASRGVTNSPSRGIADSPTRQLRESLTLRCGESGSHCLSDSARQGVDNSQPRWVSYWMFKIKLPSAVSRRVVNFPTRQVGESETPQLTESATPRYGESGSRYSKFFNLSAIFRTLNG